MDVTIRKIGDSEGIIIPKEILNRLGLKAGDTLDLTTENGCLHLRPVKQDFDRQLLAAEYFMERYEVALKKLGD